MTNVRIIEGFAGAREALTRRVTGDYRDISPSLRRSLEEMFGTSDPELAVRQIIDRVRDGGDAALRDLAVEIDHVELKLQEVARQEIISAYEMVDVKLVNALRLAAERIRHFHTRQKDGLNGLAMQNGLGQLIRPLERVGVYVPGGTASYPSTVLMTAIPARIAGVSEIILATSPKTGGMVPPTTLVALDIAGVDRIFSVGGAQAIAAMACGTESIPKVDKICGPGNIFVVIAKKLLYGVVNIDGLQGPSEVLIVADGTASPEYCAADMIAQAEHDMLAASVLITTSPRLADKVVREIERQVATLPRRGLVSASLETNGIIAVVANLDEAVSLANLYAPEHLCLMVDKAGDYVDKITNAGCVFLGTQSTVALGDYVAGPSHVLPTGGTARFSSPLNVTDFIKYINLIELDGATQSDLGQAVLTIAHAEGFEAHARAMEKHLSSGG